MEAGDGGPRLLEGQWAGEGLIVGRFLPATMQAQERRSGGLAGGVGLDERGGLALEDLAQGQELAADVGQALEEPIQRAQPLALAGHGDSLARGPETVFMDRKGSEARTWRR